MQKRDDYIESATGRRLFPTHLHHTDVDIRDIARALSNQCRFGGHCDRFYSVAEHSVLQVRHAMENHEYLDELEARVNWMSIQEYAAFLLYILLHDSPEYIVLDMPKPIKGYLPGYKDMSDRIEHKIFRRYRLIDLPTWIRPEAKHLDLSILLNERYALMEDTGNIWAVEEMGYKPLPGVEIECLSPWEAEAQFLEMFNKLCRPEHKIPQDYIDGRREVGRRQMSRWFRSFRPLHMIAAGIAQLFSRMRS